MLYQSSYSAFKGHFSEGDLRKVWLHFSTRCKPPDLSIQEMLLSVIQGRSVSQDYLRISPRKYPPHTIAERGLAPSLFPAPTRDGAFGLLLLQFIAVFCELKNVSTLWRRVVPGGQQCLGVCFSVQLSSKILLYIVKNTNFFSTFLSGGSLIWVLGHDSSVNFLLSCFDKRQSASSLQFEFRDLCHRYLGKIK